MYVKNLIRGGLLLFVGLAAVTLVVREFNRGDIAASADDALPESAVVAYYLHGDTRCPTCRDIESYAHEAITTGFAQQLASNAIEWRVVNYEQPANAHFATDYQIVAPTVVLVRTDEGKVVDWKNLDRVWELVGEKQPFIDYIQEQTQHILRATAG